MYASVTLPTLAPLFIAVLIVIVVGIGFIVTTLALLVRNTANHMSASLRQNSFHLLEILLIGLVYVSDDEYPIHLGRQNA